MPGRAREGHVLGGEIGDGFAENHRKIDGHQSGRIGLRVGLVDCYRGRRRVGGGGMRICGGRPPKVRGLERVFGGVNWRRKVLWGLGLRVILAVCRGRGS
jgi:hypothetical protein